MNIGSCFHPQDDHGQSLLHFAAIRAHAQNGLFQFLQEADINVGYRDEVYRTARDVAVQAKINENVEEIDRWVVYLAARGEPPVIKFNYRCYNMVNMFQERLKDSLNFCSRATTTSSTSKTTVLRS